MNIILQISFDLSRISLDDLWLAAIGYFVVFTALVVLYLVFSNLSRLLTKKSRMQLGEQGQKISHKEIEVSGEVNAAISMALHLHFAELHDEEPGSLTIVRRPKRYSPWNSRIIAVLHNNLNK